MKKFTDAKCGHRISKTQTCDLPPSSHVIERRWKFGVSHPFVFTGR